MEYKSNILENLQPDYIQLGSNVYADELTGNVSIGEVQSATFTDKFMVKATAGNGVNQIVLQHSGNGVAIAGIGQESSHGSLQLRLNSGATQVRLSAINSNYIIPSLGIGTTSPGAKLHVKEASGSTSQIKMSAASNEANYGYLTMLDNTVNTAKLTFGTTWGYNTPIDAMTIVNGNVGIGTAGPSVKLSVETPNVVNTAVNVLKLGDDTNGLVFKSYFDTSGIAWRLNKGLAGINMVTLSQGGNVGIDNLVPLQKLSVGGVINSDVDNDYYGAWLSGNSTAGAESYLGLGPWYNQAGYVKYYDNNRLSIYTYDTAEKLTLQESGGNVGIGMTGPNAKLQVDNGAIKIRNTVSSSPYSQVRRNINIATYDQGGATATGKLIIETPVMTTGAMATFKISGWQYDESWDLTVSGYLRIGTGKGWQQIGGAILTGNPPFDIDEVRLCYNDTTNIFYIILGDASTFWDYYTSIVINADSYYQDSIPNTGWDMSVATADPTGLSNIVTLTNIAEYGSSNAIIPGSLAIGSYGFGGRLNVQDGDAEMIFGSASSARPWLRLKHNVAPADGDEIGLQDFNAFNDADQDTRYAIWTAKAEDVTDGSEDGSLTLLTMDGGTLTNTLTGRSGKVGVNQVSPSQALDVVGKIRVTDDIIMAQQNGRIDYDGNIATGALRFFSTSGNTERMRLSSSGKLGIGITNPYSVLDVNSDISSSSVDVITLTQATNGNDKPAASFGLSIQNGGETTNAADLWFTTATDGSLTQKMRINSLGAIKFNSYNAANNTGTPTYLLGTDASGNVVKTKTGAVTGTQVHTLAATGNTASWKKLGTFTANQGGQSIFIKIVTNNGYNASISQNVEAYIRFKTSNGSSLNGGFAGDSSYYTTGPSGAFPVDNIKWVGNAAGGSATSYALYVNLPAYSGSGGFYVSENSVGTWVNNMTNESDPGVASSTVLIPQEQFRIGSTDFVVNGGGGDAYFANSNVGIGTTGPEEKLHVDGNTKLGRTGNLYAGPPLKTVIQGQGVEDTLTGNFYGSYGFLELGANTNYTGSARRFAITNALNATSFAIIRSDSNMGSMQMGVAGAVPTGAVADFVISNTGKVGIGTASPANKLTVNGDIGYTGVIGQGSIYGNTANSSYANMQLYNPATGYSTFNNQSYGYYFLTGGGAKMTILNNGNVGIGGNVPSYLLDVRKGTVSGAIARFSAINPHVIIESQTAGPAVLHLKPNITGNKSGQFKVTTGQGYNFRWSNDAASTAEVSYMKLDTSTTGGGDLTVKGDVIAYGAPSDRKYKENIKPIESALDKAMQLQGVTFDWKESDSILDIKEDIGFIAQDVEKVLPELVRDNGKGNLSLRYQGITPILLEAIKELKAEIDLLKSKPCNCNNCNCNI